MILFLITNLLHERNFIEKIERSCCNIIIIIITFIRFTFDSIISGTEIIVIVISICPKIYRIIELNFKNIEKFLKLTCADSVSGLIGF